MDSLPQIPERNYRPHTYETRLHCCKRVRESRWPIRKVAQYYYVKKPSLYRWLKRYDQRGEGALRDLPHRPKSPHPASIPKGAAYKIKCLFNKSKSNGMSSVEIWVKANAQTGLSMCYMTVLRQLKRLDGYAPYKTNPKRHCKKYTRPITPATSGRWTSSSSPRNASRRSSRATSPITNTRSWTRRPGRGSSITPTSIRCSSR